MRPVADQPIRLSARPCNCSGPTPGHAVCPCEESAQRERLADLLVENARLRAENVLLRVRGRRDNRRR